MIRQIDCKKEVVQNQADKRFYEAFYASPSIASIATAEDGKLCNVNDKWVDTFGYSPTEAIGKTPAELGIWVEPTKENLLLDRFQKGPVENVEATLRTRDGREILALLSGTHIEIDGQPLLIGVVVDITDLRQAEQRLRASEQTKAAIFAAAGESIILIDAEGIVLEANEVAAARLGKTVDEFLGQCIFDLVPPDVAKRRRALHRQMIEEVRAPMTVEDYRDGHWFETIAYPILDQGRVVQITLIARDITQRKQAEAAAEKRAAELASSNAQLESVQKTLATDSDRLQSILDNIPHGLAVFDGSKQLVVWNDLFVELLEIPEGTIERGITAESVVREAIGRGLHGPGDTNKLASSYLRDTGFDKPSHGEYRTTPSGRILQLFREPMPGGGFVATFTHITKIKRADRALHDSDEFLGRIFRSSPVAYTVSKPKDGAHYDVNEAWMKITGYSYEEAMAHSAEELGIWADKKDRDRFVERLAQEGSVRDFEAKYRAKDGTEIDMIVAGEYLDPCLSGLHPHPLGLEWAQTGYRGARHGCSRPPIFSSMAQATAISRSATDRRARAWPWPRARRAAYLARLVGSRCTATRAQW